MFCPKETFELAIYRWDTPKGTIANLKIVKRKEADYYNNKRNLPVFCDNLFVWAMDLFKLDH